MSLPSGYGHWLNFPTSFEIRWRHVTGANVLKSQYTIFMSSFPYFSIIKGADRAHLTGTWRRKAGAEFLADTHWTCKHKGRRNQCGCKPLLKLVPALEFSPSMSLHCTHIYSICFIVQVTSVKKLLLQAGKWPMLWSYKICVQLVACNNLEDKQVPNELGILEEIGKQNASMC